MLTNTRNQLTEWQSIKLVNLLVHGSSLCVGVVFWQNFRPLIAPAQAGPTKPAGACLDHHKYGPARQLTTATYRIKHSLK